MLSNFAKSAMTFGAVTGCLIATAGQAHAFTFETTWSQPGPVTGPTGDILLESVKIGNTIVDDFALVNSATIVSNDTHTGGNTGAASSDLGDDATQGTKLESATDASVQESLGNPYLSSIIDTEDKGSFEITLNFDKAFNTLLFWERGLNSDIGVKIGDNGPTKTLTRSMFSDAGYDLNTTEIGGTQNVGSYGIKLSDLGISGSYNGPITLFANSKFNGPDFKVVGATVPEPAAVLGLTAVAGAFVASRRRQSDRTA